MLSHSFESGVSKVERQGDKVELSELSPKKTMPKATQPELKKVKTFFALLCRKLTI